MLLTSIEFNALCEDATVYLDTNVFIYAHEQPELVEKIANLTTAGTAFATISSVEYEFTRGAQSLLEIKTRKQFLRGLVCRVIPVGPLLESDTNDAFSAAMSLNVNRKNSQYTDFLLAIVLHKYSVNDLERQFILTADVPAFPPQMFNVEGVLSLRLENTSIVHLNLISLDKDKYLSIINKIVTTNKGA